jgi:hypothetical protein
VDRELRVGAVDEHVAAAGDVRDIEVLAVEPGVIAVGVADRGSAVDPPCVGLVEVAEAAEDRARNPVLDLSRGRAVAIAEAEAALSVADEDGPVGPT